MATRRILPEEPQLELEEITGHPLQWQVRLRPHEATVYVSQGRTVLATSTDGFVFQHKEHGLWVYQARTLNRYRWLINGEPPRVVGASNLDQHCWMGYYIAPLPNYKQTETKDPNPTQHTIELRLVRFIGEGMREDVYVTNHNQIPTKLRLELEVEADFADPSEAGGKRKQRGKLTKRWREVGRGAWELAYDYRAEHKYAHQGDKGVARLHRGLRLRLDRATSPPKFSKNKIQFEVELPPHGTWYACLGWFASVDGKELPLEYSGGAKFQPLRSEWDVKRETFLQEATAASAPGSGTLTPVVMGAFDRARRDLAALRLYDLDGDQGAWTLAAGLPSYVSLFGRDTLASSWESLLLASEMTRGTLQRLSEHQADRVDNWRDEQPGKIVHEIHTDPLSVLNFNPHGLYFGGVTGAIYYPVVLAGLWHWTGDKELVRRYVDTALRGLHWADTYGDLDRDGFYEYQTYSEQGEKNQGWKDSGDAMVYPDGRQVKDPLGTCEMQAFVYASKIHLSEVLWWQGRADLAQKFFDEAVELKKRFNEKFWMEDEGYIAMAMDGQKRLVRSIASDPGHCLASGIVDMEHVPRLAKRLMSEEMYSGWGIRTLSARHPAYNPFSYHRGSVWPVENGVFVLAFARYGLRQEMWQLARTLFEAAALFDYFRLPEVFAGHQRDEDHPFPGLYPNANWPQAWSASAIVTIVQSLVGLYPYAPLNALLLDPHLPDWLPEITLHHIRVAGARVTLRFRRKENGETDYEVLDLHGKLHILRQPSPWSLTAGFGERVKDAIESLLPGH